VFFSLMVAGIARSLPDTLTAGLAAHGVSAVTADAVATLPPVSTLFAAFLATEFFPRLITEPLHQGLVTVFTAAAGMALVAAVASASRGRRYFHHEPGRRAGRSRRGSADASARTSRPPG
jgi:hypothetical protein